MAAKPDEICSTSSDAISAPVSPSKCQPQRLKRGRKQNDCDSIHVLSTEKKRARDRKAQQAMREKRAAYIKNLEDRLAFFSASHDEQVSRLKTAVAALSAENAILRQRNDEIQKLVSNWNDNDLPKTDGDLTHIVCPNPLELRLDDIAHQNTRMSSTDRVDQVKDFNNLVTGNNCVPRPSPVILDELIPSYSNQRPNIMNATANYPLPLGCGIGMVEQMDNSKYDGTPINSVIKMSEIISSATKSPELAGWVDPLGFQQMHHLAMKNSSDSSSTADPPVAEDASSTKYTNLGKMKEMANQTASNQSDHLSFQMYNENSQSYTNLWSIAPAFSLDIYFPNFNIQVMIHFPALVERCDDIPNPIDLLYGQSQNILANTICESFQIYPMQREVERLGIGYLCYLLIKWRIQPTRERYLRMPEYYRPTFEQITQPHPPLYDYFPHPEMRKNFLKLGHAHTNDMHDLLVQFSNCLKFRWGNEPFLERTPTGDLVMTVAFRSMLFGGNGWMILGGFSKRYPELTWGLRPGILTCTIS
ncbi:MAG: hypothetical protein M1834_009389 [Cirrosporium novae-zelandiae]|nr:MAG: hypothetical protein M1834_009389 [Cirrosporium novae-zelandiae]